MDRARKPHDHVVLLSMIVDDLDVFGARLGPSEADAPSVIDPDSVLPFPVFLQKMQLIARRRSRSLELGGVVDGSQSSFGDGNQISRKILGRLPLSYLKRQLPFEGKYHPEAHVTCIIK